MSEYQARKARMLELQREKEEDLRRELAAKAAREKQIAKEADELRKRQEAAAKEARRLELMRANEALNKKANGEQAKNDLDYNPFAEDAKPAPSAIKPIVKASSKAGPSRPTPVSSKQSVPGPSASASTSKPRNGGQARSKARAQSNSPPPLGRKEKAAKAFAQSAKRSAGDSLFSIRGLVESRDSPGPTSSRGGLARNNSVPIPQMSNYKNTGPGGPSIAVHGVGMTNGLKRDSNIKNAYAKTPKGTRESLTSQVKMEGMRKLCPDRNTRDRRTIEEIQRDIKAKRLGPNASLGETSNVDLPPKPTMSPKIKESLSKGKERSPARGKDKATSNQSRIPARPAKRRHSASPSPSSSDTVSGSDSDEDDSDSSDSDSRHRPSKKKINNRRDPYGHRGRSPPIRLDERSSQMDISSTIRDMFRRPGGHAPPRRYQDDFSDSGSEDMEAGLTDVEEEERRAARIARREDELAEQEEKRHREEKLKRKREAERKARK
ncbi:uncharacterized protein I303_104400 [Kwoniella dejecticola CBS 10117]|uniref:Protein SPT2 n=1 Tax=Kwoniella dejecticola CBS 10117 TaxID=1296121 RepID=A0A1A6A5E9_9TREE|nr:uncharacterized protein I303_04622 [Kwoniella dejecticola CBS 10117]OBR85288.1 hypothetical protein I303_04622 [Kwoniella dejecticola CBS 10117]